MQLNKGILREFRGSWGSGIGQLLIEDSDTGVTAAIPCENTSTVRALEACFGSVITPGHTASGNGFKGQEVFWSYDEFGLILGGFTPVKGAPAELIEAFEAERAAEKNQKGGK